MDVSASAFVSPHEDPSASSLLQCSFLHTRGDLMIDGRVGVPARGRAVLRGRLLLAARSEGVRAHGDARDSSLRPGSCASISQADATAPARPSARAAPDGRVSYPRGTRSSPCKLPARHQQPQHHGASPARLLPGHLHLRRVHPLQGEHQLIQLKQRLEDTERALEKLASKVGPFSDGRSGGEQEERLLSQLQEIARTLRESTDFAGVDSPGGGTHPQHDSAGGECPGHQAAAEGEHSPSVEEAGTAVCAEGSTETPTGHTQLGETMGPTSKSDRCDESNDVDAKDHDAGYEQSHVTAHCTGVRGPSEMEVENLSPDVGGPSETDEGRDGSGEEFKQHADEQTSGVRKRIAASMEKM
ncbi:uncharacterized protein LOC144933789 isoform X1 [Lampetra fluviatilis]